MAAAGTGASAATFPDVTFRAVVAALPVFHDLPGKVGAAAVDTRLVTSPCLYSDSHPAVVLLPGSVPLAERIGATKGRFFYNRSVAWSVGIAPFASPKAATAWLAKFAKAQRSCATSASYRYPSDGKLTTLRSRQLSLKHVTTKGWTGYRGVDVLRNGLPASTQRQVWSVLVRGNALVFLSVTVDSKGLSAAHQEQWRQKVQDRISADLVRFSG